MCHNIYREKCIEIKKKKKNISFSALARRLERVAELDGCGGFRVYDLVPAWRPSPRDVQISVQLKRHSEPKRSFFSFHQRFVLKLHIRGESEGYVENNFFRFRQGEGILVFPFQIHRITAVPTPEGQLRVLANFTLPAADQTFLEPLRNRVFPLDGKLLTAAEELVKLSARIGPADGQAAVEHLAAMLAALRGKVLETPPVFAPAETPAPGLFECIRDGYLTGISVKELAARLGVSEGSVRRRFLRETGKSPGQAIRELRLKEAAELLRTTREPIREIGERCGFSTPFSFSRAFRRRFGVPPRAFRNGDAGELPSGE